MANFPKTLLLLAAGTFLTVGCGEKDCDTASCPEADCDTDADSDTDTDTDTDADTDADADVETVVVVTGGVYVAVGETVELAATTYNDDDGSYSWSTSDDAIATVDESGVVTGVYPGEVEITATGDDSGAAGVIGLYVENEIPNFDDWLGSGHADHEAEAFRHWDEDDPAEISTSCAKCHSTPGFMDFIGADGTDAEVVDAAAAIGTVIECEACHNPVADELSHVIFPSEVEITGLGGEARCMTCHQGRESKDSVDEAITEAGEIGDDEVSEKLGFENVHYYPAGATLLAGQVRGGYQYDEEVYDWRFRHVPDKDVCTECHDPHTLAVELDDCIVCHDDAADVEDLKDIRMIASVTSDYDGDGDLDEGIYYEIQGLQDLLYEAIQLYPAESGGDSICYDALTYPYWMIDTDGSGGECDEDEASYSNQYGSWTPRLLRAAYNFQMVAKDPGGFAHNAKYLIELQYDSITDLNTVLSAAVDMEAAERSDPGHFDGAGEAARHWDEDEEVSTSCAKCHGGADGFRFWLSYETGLEELEQGNGLDCYTCHEDFEEYSVIELDSVLFESEVEIEDEGAASNICGTCHSGRKWGGDVDDTIADGDYDFQNVHYLPAAGVLQGADAMVGYEFAGQEYDGVWTHSGGTDCTDCHDPVETQHTFDVDDNFDAYCALCHSEATEIHEIRQSEVDTNGNGDTTESLHDELETLVDELYAEIQAAGDAAGAAICYDAHTYPYWMNDTDASGGECDESEASYSNQYGDWTGEMLMGAYNYQLFQKEHGAWAHNFNYMAQLLIDSIDALGGDVSGYTRP